MPNLAKASNRHEISNRQTLLQITMCDFGIITPQDSFEITDKNKIRSARLQQL